MSKPLSLYIHRFALLLCMICVILILDSCQREEEMIDISSQTYRDAVAMFYTSIAAIQASAEVIAEEKMIRVTELAPQEPAAWANLGLLALRRTSLDLAAERLQKARELAPENSKIQALSGLFEKFQGRLDAARAYLQRSVVLAPNNLKALYALAQVVEEQGGETSVVEAQRLLTQLLDLQPDNLAVLLELARINIKQGDIETLQQTIARLEARATAWEPMAQEQLRALQIAASTANPSRMTPHMLTLKNVLVRDPSYREGRDAIHIPFGQIGEVIPDLLWLPSPSSQPAAPDTSLAFAVEQLPIDGGPWTWINAVALNGEDAPVVMLANGSEVRMLDGVTLKFAEHATAPTSWQNGVAGVDFNADFRVDLALVGPGGLALFRQDDTGVFTNATAHIALPDTVTSTPYTGVWPADIDLEGDLDIVLGSPAGPPFVLQNNGDGAFVAQYPFGEVAGLRDFIWGDFDAEGAPDAILLDAAGALHVYINQRSGRFQTRALPPELGKVLAMTVADVNSDSALDLVALQADGVIQRLSYQAERNEWRMAKIAQWPDWSSSGIDVATPRLLVADMDNNGSLDLIASAPTGGHIWLQDEQGEFRFLDNPLPGLVFAASELTGDGRLDLLGLSKTGQPLRLVNQGSKDYRWLTLRPRAAPTAGDQRINTFALGGEIEVRAGLLFQKQPITTPILHFGLGEHHAANVVRIVWPNGDVMALFDLDASQTVLAKQRLKGSCPWLFAYNGEAMGFVTDFLWRSPLGLRINAQDTADVMMTTDWVKIRGDQLRPRDGVYDLRITAELWETHFFDHVSLLVVDHPAETDVYVDERFAIPPPQLAAYPTATPRPVARAWDDYGQEVTDAVRARDGRYLDTFGRGVYQGVTRDHYVEIDLGPDAPSTGPLWLLASGWIRPTDSSINVAISQGRLAPPQGVRLEIPDGQGGWAARGDLGFPAGKNKTILIDLQGLWRPGEPRLLRLRTNMEIYWDALAWAPGLPDAAFKTQRLHPHTAELRYRGFSVVRAADRSSPELPAYHELEGTAPRWRDLTGYYTRFGDVRELLQTVDDRYVIMNAGDELALRFDAPPPPPAGWRRDFVLIGDGWVKDGDYNTTFSQTVRPLPSHDHPSYATPPGQLEDDPVYQRHAQDWQRYHTRYMTPHYFREALRTP